MLTVRIPESRHYECTTYLAHNAQYPDREYYIEREASGSYVISFNNKPNYLAFCGYWSRVIL